MHNGADMCRDSRRDDAHRLAAETGVDPRTAKRWLDGQRVYVATNNVLSKAAKELGIYRDGPNDSD